MRVLDSVANCCLQGEDCHCLTSLGPASPGLDLVSSSSCNLACPGAVGKVARARASCHCQASLIRSGTARSAGCI